MKENGLLEVPAIDDGDKQENAEKKENLADKLFIEYGAGRAGLSSYVADRLEKGVANFKFIIVDRDTRRRKLDKNFREEFDTFREKMDIADFDLEKFVRV